MKSANLPKIIQVLPKPSLGKSCNSCGYCCIQQPCLLAQEFLQCTEGPCIALEVESDKRICGLVRQPAFYMFGEEVPASETGRLSVFFAQSLGLGLGCDADDPS